MMADPCGRFIGEEITSRILEEIQDGSVFPRRGIRYINDHRRIFQNFGEPFARESVDPCIRCCSYGFMPVLTQLVDKL